MFIKRERFDVEKGTLIYEGKAKQLFQTDDPVTILNSFLKQNN